MSAVIFDLDGTLIDASRDIHACACAMFAAEGLPPLDLPTVKGFVGKGLGNLVSRCIAARGLDDTPDRHARMYATFHAAYETAVAQTVLYPNVLAALDALKAEGYRLALCTNKPQGPTRAVVAHLKRCSLRRGSALVETACVAEGAATDRLSGKGNRVAGENPSASLYELESRL